MRNGSFEVVCDDRACLIKTVEHVWVSGVTRSMGVRHRVCVKLFRLRQGQPSRGLSLWAEGFGRSVSSLQRASFYLQDSGFGG
jgi:TolB-like protein